MSEKFKPSKEAIAKLRWVQKQILSTPQFYEQNLVVTEQTHCGTTCCLAGWIHYNDVGAKKHNDLVKGGHWEAEGVIIEHAIRSLGFPAEYAYNEEWPNLFDDSGAWPDRFAFAYSEAKTPLEAAQVAVRRIDHFIETGE
jgi:hypothetical protein